PFCTGTVWSVVVTAMRAKSTVAIIISSRVVLRSPFSVLRSNGERRTENRERSRFLVRVARQRGGAAEQIVLLAPRLDQMPAQVAVRRIRGERLASLRDGAVDDRQVLFDDRNRRLVEPSAAFGQRALEIGN